MADKVDVMMSVHIAKKSAADPGSMRMCECVVQILESYHIFETTLDFFNVSASGHHETIHNWEQTRQNNFNM